MKQILIVFAAVFISFSAGMPAQEPVDLATVHRIKAEGFSNSKVMETAFYLTDVFGPKLSGSPQLKNTEEWAVKQLTEWGLVNAQRERWGTFGKGWETKKCYVAMTAPYYQAMIAVPKAWTAGTNGLIKGKVEVLKIEKEEDLEKYKGRLKDKIVMVARDASPKPSFKPDASRYTEEELKKLALDRNVPDDEANARENDYSQYRTLRTLRQKITKFLEAEQPAAILSCRSGTMGTIFTSNGAPFALIMKPGIPELEMGEESVNRIARLAAKKMDVEVELEIVNVFHTADSTQYNVIAEIPGTDKLLKNEVVMLGGHLDSWHGATGATDNAAGCAVMMEAVRILKAIGVQPRRTIRIALWSGEEQGLYGSRNYVKNHFADPVTMALKPEHSKISAYYNLDNGAGRIRGIYLQGNDALRPIFEAWFEPFRDLEASTVTTRNTGSTDHVPFDVVGIPGFQFIQDKLEYNTRTHHTNMDTYDRLPENDLKQASVIVASIVYHTAMRDQLLPRKPLPKPRNQESKGVGGTN